MKKRKRLPEYVILESIKKIDNPEKSKILNSKKNAIKAFNRRSNNGHN